ncbi:MAG: polyprenyl synthetase family protein [Candidatus Omnitrophica bacterium]|nr:polyprenyl synthetase family protein [Candidatus Omnitrophota bacterium]HOX55104.1 polyprenyl synthetase family protein [Candidatus Omnitrophota bacterium]
MLSRIKNNIDKNLKTFVAKIDKLYSISAISPLLFQCIKDFVLRDGKRVRPILFVTGYLGYAKKAASDLYTSALSIELLHDFMLVHDDIIDKSATRRGKPSMHELLNKHLKKYKNIKFNGQDLSIVVGDVMYATAINAFLTINENMERKEKALKKFIEAAIYTGSGEFIELINGAKAIEKVTKQDIDKIYDYKTARYTFSTPLTIGAILAGSKDSEINKLFKFGIYLGRAFQIQDDILGMFGDERKIGKSTLSDLQESKKTLLIWHAYNNAERKNKIIIKYILSKNNIFKKDLLTMRRIVKDSGSLEYCQDEIAKLKQKSLLLLSSLKMRSAYRNSLSIYCNSILKNL